jgi:DASH complex subunit SPC19
LASTYGSDGQGQSTKGGHSKKSVQLSELEALKMTQMRQKKERLSYAIDRLQLQAHQKERQLRKSMAAPGMLE